MYSHLDEGSEVMCVSQRLPTLFRNAGGYPAPTDAIRNQAREVSGFVRDGMAAMMQT